MGVTLIFPGQGSQYVGMGKSLIDDTACKEVYEKADEVLGYKISSMCFEGPESELKLTENTQPAIITHSIALFNKLKKVLDSKNIKIDRVLGHSVGEYAALVAAGSLDFETAVMAVHLRGKYMQEAVPVGKGAMYAILRVPADIVEKACLEVSTEEETVMPANFNEPGQVVISGDASACERAVKWLKENYLGKQMAIALKVSAPFHSGLMKPAETKLASFFESVNFKSNTIPYVANVDAKEYLANTDKEEIKENLIKQVCASVLWSQSILSLPNDTVFIEVGPGKVLTGLNNKMNTSFRTFTLDNNFEGLEEFLS